MLVLSRFENERIVFPTLNIVVEVVEIRGDKVRLGIAADAGVPVHREEVWAAIQREKENAVPKVSKSP
jgi:carbon storage regulator